RHEHPRMDSWARDSRCIRSMAANGRSAMNEHEEISSPPGGRPTAFLADLAGPLKFISYFFFVIAGLVLVGAGVNAIRYDEPFTLGTGIVLIVLLNIGWGIRKGATFLAAG